MFENFLIIISLFGVGLRHFSNLSGHDSILYPAIDSLLYLRHMLKSCSTEVVYNRRSDAFVALKRYNNVQLLFPIVY
ncbi:hypothetical protein MTR_8g015540 [Medicago truncatula]|uniref:Transmembrane protein n=1 Tax=Medicago truncatula TaxID=3880 RepID=A0A072TXL1_MEDTR|nr:hypothetical protein MTR_8g015540 [Medicago truncatula]